MSGKGNEARVSAKQLKERGARVRSEQGNVAHACLCFACAFALVFPAGKVRIGSGSQETTTVRVEDWRCGVGRADERAHHAVCSAPPPAVASGIASAAATAPSVHPFIVPRPSLSSGITSPDKRPHRSRARSCSLPMKTCSPHAPWTSAMVNLHANGAILIAGDKNRPHAAPRLSSSDASRMLYCCCSTPLQHACDRHSIMGT